MLPRLSRRTPAVCRRAKNLSTHRHSAGCRLAVALDIDGVLLRGGNPIPSAKQALRKLAGENARQMRIPFIFLTNGGGVDEATKARQLSEMFDMYFDPEQVILSHSPLRKLIKDYPHVQDEPALIVGPETCKDVALQYDRVLFSSTNLLLLCLGMD